MSHQKKSLAPTSRAHLLCYLVANALASHALTKTWRVEYVVESARIWFARNRVSASWLERLTLGQLALKLSREYLAIFNAVRQLDRLTLFTNELMLNYQSPLVGRVWQRCRDALSADTPSAGA
jgi:hypothetical protein